MAWADYIITGVRYDSTKTAISEVEVRTHTNDTLTNTRMASRSTVVANLKVGQTYVTSTKNSNGVYSRGEDVRVVRVNGTDYIRSDANSIAKDNLGS
jgi:hypothetical protein